MMRGVSASYAMCHKLWPQQSGSSVGAPEKANGCGEGEIVEGEFHEA